MTAKPASRIGFGASALGTMYAPMSDEQAHEALTAAYSAGFRSFDTAPLYGHGLSELRLGRFLRSVPRGSFTLSTKVGRYLVPPRGEAVDRGIWADPLPLRPVFDYSYDGTMRALEQSASRLGVSDPDIVHIHDVDRFTHGDQFERRFDEAMEGSYRALDELRRAGHLRAVGLGINDSATAARFLRAGQFDVVLIAGRYTLLEQTALDDLLPEAERQRVQVVAAGVFNSGILAAASAADPSATYDYAPAPAPVIARVRSIAAICEAHGVSIQAAAIQFPLCHPAIASVLLGMSSAAQALQNAASAAVTIPDALWPDLKSAGLLRADAPVAPMPGSG